MLNKSGETGYPCLFPDPTGKTFNFSWFSVVSCGLVICDLYYVEVCFLYTHSIQSFYHDWMLNLANVFCASIELIIWFLSFIIVVIILIYLQILNHPFIPRINPTYSWCMNLLMTVEYGLLRFHQGCSLRQHIY